MSFREVDNSNRSTKFLSKKMMLVIIIVVVAGFVFGVWFFSISESDNAIQNSENYLPPNCYSVNGKQTCPIK